MDRFGDRLRCIPRFLAAIDRRAGRRLAPEVLEDLAQDCAVRVLERLPDYLALAPFEAWVHRICFLSYMNAVRTARRNAARSTALDEQQLAADGDRLAMLLRQEAVEQGLERLGGIEAEVVRIRHFEGLDFDAIGARLGEKPATVKTRYYRGFRKLRGLLEAAEEEHRG